MTQAHCHVHQQCLGGPHMKSITFIKSTKDGLTNHTIEFGLSYHFF